MKTTHLRHAVLAVAVAALISPVSAAAQDSYWGISAEFTPKWESMEQLDLLYDAEALDIAGTDFRIGFVRGRTLGGDWGVSLVRKRVEEGGLIDREGDVYTFANDVALTGVEVNKFASFGTIRDRAQIGLIVGGGVARLRGTAFSAVGEAVDAREVFSLTGEEDFKVHPLFRLELAGTGIVTAGLKLRVSGGFDWPGLAKFSVGAVYFFGER